MHAPSGLWPVPHLRLQAAGLNVWRILSFIGPASHKQACTPRDAGSQQLCEVAWSPAGLCSALHTTRSAAPCLQPASCSACTCCATSGSKSAMVTAMLQAAHCPARGPPVRCNLYHNYQAIWPCNHTATASPPWRHQLYPHSSVHVSACVPPLTPLPLSCPSGAICITTTRPVARPNTPPLHPCACRCPALQVLAAPWPRGHHLRQHAGSSLQ